MMKLDTWEGRENLENTKETIEKFKKEYLWQRNYLDRQIRDITRNIGKG